MSSADQTTSDECRRLQLAGNPRPSFTMILKATWDRWLEDGISRHGAALAYYMVFSLAPMALAAVMIAGTMFEEEVARQEMIREINASVGPRVGSAIEGMVESAKNSGGTGIAAVVSFGVLLFGASSVFAQLQDSLNTIWRVKLAPDRGFFGMIKDRIWSFLVVIGIGVLLLASLVLSTVRTAAAQVFADRGQTPLFIGPLFDWLISLALITVLFAFIYKLLPDVYIHWGDVWAGAAFTAVLFTAGKYWIGLYLARSSWISAYGAAGSLIVVLLWVYYSAQIFLFGAEFTYVYSRHCGKSGSSASEN